MKSIILPNRGPKSLYYNTFVGYIKNIFSTAGYSIIIEDYPAEHCYFYSSINNRKVCFNFSDFYEIPAYDGSIPYFKLHYNGAEFKDKKIYFRCLQLVFMIGLSIIN